MLVKVKIQSDINGKYYTHKKKKIHIQKKCLKLLPKKDEFNIYVKDDGVKYYHIGYRKVYLGNDIEVSKNICDELEQVITHKKRKIDKVIVDSITEIKAHKKRKRKAKTAKKDDIVKVAQNVIGRGDRELEKRAEKAEDFSNKQGKPQTYHATRAKLIAMNDKVQQVKNTASEKGWTHDQKQRAVKEVKQQMTAPPNQPNMLPQSQQYPALSTLFEVSKWEFDKQGLPVFPKQDFKMSSKEAEDLVAKKEREREEEEEELFAKQPPREFFKPIKTKISSFGKTLVKRVSKRTEPKPDPQSTPIAEVEGKATPPPSPVNIEPPKSNEEKAIEASTIELEQRLLEIQNYLDQDATDIERFKDHLTLLGEKTQAEKDKVKKVATVISKKRKALIAEYMSYSGDFITSYVSAEKNNPFSDKVLKKFGQKKEVERQMKQTHNVEKALASTKKIDTYERLNYLVDEGKHNPKYKKEKIDAGVKNIVAQLKQLRDKNNKTGSGESYKDFYKFAAHIVNRFTVGNTAVLPTAIHTFMKEGSKPVEDVKLFKDYVKSATSVKRGLEDTADYYNNPVFNHEIFEGLKRDIRRKFPETTDDLLSDDTFNRAYHGDKLDATPAKQSGTFAIKKSAGSSGLDVLKGTGGGISNVLAHNQIEDDFDLDQQYQVQQHNYEPEGKESDEEEEESEDEGEGEGFSVSETDPLLQQVYFD